MPRTIRAVFFDAGNTLILPRLEDLARDVTALGYPASVEDFHAAERFGKARFDEWLWPQIHKGEVPGKVDHYYWGEYLRALMERLGVPEADRERGAYLAVISNSIGTMEQQLERVGLGRYFAAVFDSAIVGVEKPHPAIFRLALERARVAAAEAVFVGDTNATDMGGAHLAGLAGVLIDRIGAYPEAEGARITSLKELPGILGIAEKLA